MTLIEFVNSNFFWFAMATIALASIICGATKSILKTQARERTRREIAAYIAEGSMTPEQGERLMNAGRSSTIES